MADRNGVEAIPVVGCYLRVSTLEQKRKQSPLETQRRVCLDACDRRFGRDGYRVEIYSDEGISGTVGPREEGEGGKYRPAFTRLIEDLRRGRLDYLGCQSPDRLARDERDMFGLRELLADRDVKIITPDREYDLRNAEDCLMLGVHTLMAAYQPRQTSGKSREGKTQRARRGLAKSGATPYGWRLESVQEASDPGERNLVPVPEEGRWVQKMVELYQRGWGYKKIAAFLAEQGAPAPSAAGWYGGLVQSQLQNPKHAGMIEVSEGEYVEGRHFADRYYDLHVFTELQREMQRRTGLQGVGRRSSYFLIGTLSCGCCGSPMRAGSHSEARYYQCNGSWREPAGNCPNPARKADHVERVVLNAVREFALSRRVQRLITDEVDELLSEDDKGIQDECAQKRRKLEQVNDAIQWLIAESARKPELRGQFDAEVEAHKRRLDRLQAEYDQIAEQAEDVEARRRRARRVYEIVADFDAVWERLEGDERRQVISLLFEELTLSPAEEGSLLRVGLFLGRAKEVFIPAVKPKRRPSYGLKGLTLRQCAALYLKDQGLAAREIAERWGCGPSNVNTLLLRARKKLRVDTTEQAIGLSRQHIKTLLPFLSLDGPIPTPPSPSDLTETERKLLPDIANADLLYREIGERHGLKENTVKVHSASIAGKLRARGRAELIGQVKRLRLLDGSGGKGNDVHE